MNKTTEDAIEQAALAWLEELGYQLAQGADLAFDGPVPERSATANYGDVVLEGRLQDAIERLNPELPREAVEEVRRRVVRTESPSLIENNRAFHRLLTDGVDVSWMDAEGEKHAKAWLVDPADVETNDWLAVNQFTVVENKRTRRPDIVVFVNGLPLAVVELKNAADEKATLRHAYNQLQTYKEQIPSLFAFNELLVISDGMEARMGSLTAGWDRFMPWRTIDGTDLYREPGNARQSDGVVQPGLETLFKGVFDRERLLDYALSFVTFEHDGGESTAMAKKAAAYHQYHAVNKAVECTLSACGIEAPANLRFGRFVEAEAADPFRKSLQEVSPGYRVREQFGDRRVGVVWHTQGSGKSLSMMFYASKLIRHPYMRNPTVVVITDRNDLDEQLFGTFAANCDLLRQTPMQAAGRDNLRELLQVASGGVIFTTIQKFLPDNRGDAYPLLSERRNIVVMADEAHRSQYDFIDGFARHMHDALPNASFIGFTGTPIENDDRSTPAVFGHYIDKYDILRAVEDGATVPIYYESRLARIELNDAERPVIDTEFEQITEGEEEETRKQRMRSKWASVEAMVGTDKRIRLVAKDLVEHFEKRQEAMQGKALVVCMSRRICVDMYNAIIALRPGWHSDDDAKGRVKIVMSGSASDELDWQPHIRSKKAREALARRFKAPADDLELVIVRDMWLTGFDCPAMHTMYLDKPMGGHNLMQAIARVNRVFKDKPGGRVVDYLGIAEALKRALQTYTASGGRGQATVDQAEAVAVMQEKVEVVRDLLHGFDFRAILQIPFNRRMTGIANAMDFVLGLEDGKKRYLQAVASLSKAFALAVPHDAALAIRDEVGLFQEIRSSLAKATTSDPGQSAQAMETAIRQLVSRAVSSNEVVDIFSAAGLDKPDISILSDQFLADVQQLPQKNLALEMLKKLLNDEIKTRHRKNVVQARSFAEMLEEAVNKYQNRAIEAAEVIEELIKLAREMRKAGQRGEKLGLNDDEIAFYDALEINDSAVQVMGDDTLKLIARELVDKVRSSVSVDWTQRENARAQIRVMVKRILRKYGYPPDQQAQATELVLEQATVLCHSWV
ncbi:type I restriction endonuclease subunit R [Chromohalobacter sp. HP20-39]|uniref:type I restriction endonuclease subunit R n=1 Tax=Chromohalobacter sp. HP20-39 TaxID=3079306 RepID=UPI00294B8859|nr:type I restriction endonuclease subunit R [Chromohalobacter sp. HP20-39]MDV6318681.1 type I restriction endonuclease subunit R [Chromohalobacter sp. HP20-39]